MVVDWASEVSNPLRAGRVVTYAWIIITPGNPVNRKNKGAGWQRHWQSPATCLVPRSRTGPVGFAGAETGLVSQPHDRLGLENKVFREK